MQFVSVGSRPIRLIAFSLVAAACASKNSGGTESSYTVPLTLRPVGDSVWEAAFGSGTAQSRFRVRPHIKQMSDSSGFAFTSWTLYPVAGSVARPLLTALAKAHNIPDTIGASPRSDSLLVDVALLGINAAQSRDGSFGASNTGDWIAAKLFFADGEAEVYLNLNPQRHRAEFSVKDEEYGALVVRELARILSG